MVYCSVCLNNNRKNNKISYFNYPKDDNRRKCWLKAVGREDLLLKLANSKIRQQYRICEDHFESYCIRFSSTGNIKMLYEFAFPTLNLPQNEGEESAVPAQIWQSNTGTNLNQFEELSMQNNVETHHSSSSEIILGL